MPQVSIIVPVFNVESQIAKCIESIVSQTFDDWELILVDDGSPDKSGDICDSFAACDERIRVIHKQNEGVSIARNTGLKSATGRYVCFVDSDDYVGPNYISSLLDHASGDDTIIYGNVCHVRNGKKCGVAFAYENGFMINKGEHGHNIEKFGILENGFPIAKLFPRRLIEDNRLRFNSNLSLHEDHIFVLQALGCASRIILCDDAQYYYVHQESGTSLSQRRHSASKLIMAANELIGQNDILFDQFGVTDKTYMSRVYTLLGLNQLVRAYLVSSKEDEPAAISAICDKKRWFKEYYRPNHGIVRIIPYMAYHHIDFLMSWIKKLLGSRS